MFLEKKAITQQTELVGQKIREILIVVLELVVGSGEKGMYLPYNIIFRNG